MVQDTLFPKQPPQENDYNAITSPKQQSPHFNADLTDEELTATFEKLKQGKYIHSESDLDTLHR